MAESALKISAIGKRYTLEGRRGRSGDGLRHLLQDALSSSLRRLAGRSRNAEVEPSQEFWALRNVSFEIGRGEVVGIVGRNGAGKSTLLKILSRITEPTEGRIEIEGRVASLLEVGTGFHPELTGRENIYLNGAILGMSRREIREKFDEIVAFAEVEKFLDTPVKRYSSGMYVRLAFAVAAHLDPEILIVDEVLAVGDAAFQKRCLGKMKGIAGQGRTILFVSHNMHAVQGLCHRAIHLKQGTVADSGPAGEVARRYLAELSEPGKGVVHVASPCFKLLHATAHYTEKPDDDVEITVEVGCASQRALDGLYVNIALENEDEVRILQFMPKAHERPTDLHAPGSVTLRYRAASLPHLRPGAYTLTVYACLSSGPVLSHVTGIPAFTVAATSRQPESLQADFTAVMMPRFSMDVRCREDAVLDYSLAL